MLSDRSVSSIRCRKKMKMKMKISASQHTDTFTGSVAAKPAGGEGRNPDRNVGSSSADEGGPTEGQKNYAFRFHLTSEFSKLLIQQKEKKKSHAQKSNLVEEGARENDKYNNTFCTFKSGKYSDSQFERPLVTCQASQRKFTGTFCSSARCPVRGALLSPCYVSRR